MSGFLDILLRAVLLENLALTYLLGMCTFIAVSRQVAVAMGVGAAVVMVLLITVPLNQLLYSHLLAPGALAWAGLGQVDLSFMRLLTFIGVIAALVQVLELVISRHAPVLRAHFGAYLPLLTVNCAILGGSLLMVQRELDFTGSVAWGLGAGLGWALAIVLFAALRERLETADVPQHLQGIGIAFLVTGLLALAVSGFTGIQL